VELAVLTFFLGVGSLWLFAELPNWHWLWLMVIPVLVLCGNIINICRTNKIVTLTSMLIFGLCWALLRAHLIASWELPKTEELHDLVVVGNIASLPQETERDVSFILATKSINSKSVATKLKLSWYGAHPQLVAGDQCQLHVRLKRPHAIFNPGGVDLEKQWFEKGIRAIGYVVANPENKLITTSNYYPVLQLRQRLQQQIMSAQLKQKLSGVVTALVIGDESQITRAEWQTMQQTGTSYLVAISGLHIGLVAGIIFFLVKFLWSRGSRLPLLIPAKKVAALASFVMGLIYSLLSGFSIPTQRAMVMLTVFLATQFFQRHLPPWRAFFIALFGVLFLNPFAILTIGFWLSFTAVAVIIFVTQGRKNFTPHKIKWYASLQNCLAKYWRMQLALMIGLLPFTLLFFQQTSFSAILANIIAMPGVCLVVVPIALLGVFGLIFPSSFGSWIIMLANKILVLIWWWLEQCTNLHWLFWQHAIPNFWVLLAAVGAVAILLAPRGFPAKAIGLIWLLPLFFYRQTTPQYGDFWFTLLDVGQGLASVLQTQHHLLIYDTGLKQFTNDTGTTVINPFLRQLGISDVDVLMISHGDNDHIGGAVSVIAQNNVHKIITSVPGQFCGLNAHYCFSGQKWEWDGVEFTVLSPAFDAIFAGNNASCVLKVSNGKNSLLLTGDIERESENSLIASNAANLAADVIVAPHHGSATSSTLEFISAVKPRMVFFPVGYRNRFRFPAKSVVKRYQALGAQLFDVASGGAIFLQFPAHSKMLVPSLYRHDQRHFWNDCF
jgi:competence protein ComEC